MSEPSDVPHRMMHLPDGEYLMRALNQHDRSRLQDFFYSHTEETVYQRYGHPVKVMSDEDGDRLVSVDQHSDLAMALFEVHGQTQIIHAVGRYCLDPAGKRAEVAFVVRENKRHLGCATCLLQEMIRIARQRGLHALWATVLPGNLPMLKVLRKFRFVETSRDRDSVELELILNKGCSPCP